MHKTNALLDRIIHGDALFVIVPDDCGDFYVSGAGYLCCRVPLRATIHDKPVGEFTRVMGFASEEETIESRLAPDERERVVKLERPQPF